MVAFEVVHNGRIVENAHERADVKTETESEVKFKRKNEISNECARITPKVQNIFGKLQKLRIKEETQHYTLNLPSIGTEDCIGVCERDSAVTSIKSMQRFYNYNCDTLADAINYLDRFISKVKVKRRYLSCVATAAFFLSTKMNEESEYHPTASDLSSLHRHSWKPTDLKRMEKILLEKLDWNLHPSVTSLSYIHIIFRMLSLVSVEVDRQFFDLLVQRSELYMNYTRCARYQASTLALSIVQQCLKEADLSSSLIKYLLIHVQTVFKISDSELFECQCAISKQLELYNTHPSTHPRCLPIPKIVPRPNLIKRPSFYGNTGLPTIEEVSWSTDSSEDEESQLPHLDNGFECHTTQPLKMTQSYCRLLDQCYPTVQGALYYYKKCNITVL
ncbi:cyclin-G1-like [Mercenaria mercenaria]|uniref:cyclin-G1-like n=1 Tax=Mercenaria mercenaria TaxID=6596 RepID=UPI00234E8965|nr:cyclin-G1-like [Mercenaria mercenaria]